MNIVVLNGNFARDPELRYTPRGVAVLDFTLASNRRWKGEDGEEKEDCAFVECTSFGKQAEVIAQYLRMGDPLLINGRLKQETWESKDGGGKRSKLKVIVEAFTFIGNKKEASDAETASASPHPASGYRTGPGEQSRAAGRQQVEKDTNGRSVPVEDDDVPF